MFVVEVSYPYGNWSWTCRCLHPILSLILQPFPISQGPLGLYLPENYLLSLCLIGRFCRFFNDFFYFHWRNSHFWLMFLLSPDPTLWRNLSTEFGIKKWLSFPYLLLMCANAFPRIQLFYCKSFEVDGLIIRHHLLIQASNLCRHLGAIGLSWKSRVEKIMTSAPFSFCHFYHSFCVNRRFKVIEFWIAGMKYFVAPYSPKNQHQGSIRQYNKCCICS